MVKIDTKENFRVFEVIPSEIHANMAGDFREIFLQAAAGTAVIVDWKNVTVAEKAVLAVFAEAQTRYQQANQSFVMTAVAPGVLASIKELPGYETLNIVPTFREAVDLVMMEQLERELLNPEE